MIDSHLLLNRCMQRDPTALARYVFMSASMQVSEQPDPFIQATEEVGTLGVTSVVARGYRPPSACARESVVSWTKYVKNTPSRAAHIEESVHIANLTMKPVDPERCTRSM